MALILDVSIPVEGTHKALSPEERKASGITDNLVRLSVGIEDSEDLLQDFENALICTLSRYATPYPPPVKQDSGCMGWQRLHPP